MKTKRSTRSLPCRFNSLILIVCYHYVNFAAKINQLELQLELQNGRRPYVMRWRFVPAIKTLRFSLQHSALTTGCAI